MPLLVTILIADVAACAVVGTARYLYKNQRFRAWLDGVTVIHWPTNQRVQKEGATQ